MFEIRDMRPEDLEEVAGIEKNSFSDPWSKSSFEDMLSLPAYRALVITENDKVAGYACTLMVLDEGQILNIAIDKSQRRRGLGRMLLKYVLEQGKEQGACFFTLEVRESNKPAIGLYESFGFRETGRRKNYYDSPVETAILMDLKCF